MSSPGWRVIEWAADECERQRSGEQSVVWMLRGWQYTMRRLHYPRTATIDRPMLLELASIVEPRHNDGTTFRCCDVRVGTSIKMPYEQVDRAIDNLLAVQADLEPDEWFRQYEEIHPLRDGNGRTGSILWNLLRGTLHTPEDAPNFWV